MKLNWGHKLVICTILFMLFIITLVVIIGKQKIDLVDANYYENGIRYQEEIDKYAISDSIHHAIEAGKDEIIFTTNLPQMEGIVYFYRPSDNGLDFSIPFLTSENGRFSYPTASLAKGLWTVTFEWTLNGRRMASEKQIVKE